MKQAAKPDAGHDHRAVEPVRSRPAQAWAVTSGGPLAQLTGIMNDSPRVEALAQLREDIRQSPRMRSVALNAETMGAEPAGPVAQPKLVSPFESVSGIKDAGILRILEEIETYNKIGGYRFTFPLDERKLALTQLGVIERLIYAWFGDQRSPDLDTSQININMKTLMNRVSVERQALVEIAISKNDGDPPVANFDALPGLIKGQITELWKLLLAGKGIQIDGPKEFKIKILSDFTRLLETEMGRTLTGGIIQTGQGLVITATTLEKGKFVARPNEAEYEGLEETETHENYVPVDVRDLDESQRLRLLQHVRGANPKSPGMSVRSERGVRHFRFGKGTGSTLPVPANSADAMAHASSRMADRYGNEVIAPTFINLGHELGHVLRSAQGISAATEGGSSLLGHSFQEPEVSRPEEFFNIGGVENRLREESGMMSRYGHGNLYSHWAVEGMNTIESLQNQIKEDLKEVAPESVGFLRLKSLQKELIALEEPFQLLMNGKGKIKPLLEALARIKASVYFG